MNNLQSLILGGSLAVVSPAASALELYWEPLPGRAKDIGVGADGSVWIVGSGIANGDVYRWSGSEWSLIGGAGVFIAVGAQGDPWVVNFSSNLYHRINNQWQLITQSGSATSIGVGADGTVLIAGGKSCFCGPVSNQRLYRYMVPGGFVELPGLGSAVVIEPDGTGWWSLDSVGRIFRWQGGPEYVRIDGHARDISRSANGDIWIIGGGAFELGNDQIFRWNGTQFEKTTTGQAAQISVGPDGTPWIINDGGQIFRGHFLQLQVTDVTTVVGQELRFPITLSYPSDRLTSVSYQVFRSDNSVVTNGSLSFAVGQIQQTVVLPTAADPASGESQTYRLQLASAVGADLLRASAIGIVTSNSAPPPTLTPLYTTAGGFAVRFASRTGFRYLLQRRDQATLASSWAPVASLNGTGSPIELGDTTSPATQGYYRVVVTPINP